MTLLIVVVGVAAAAALGLITTGLVMWRQQGIIKNDVDHLKRSNEKVERCLSGIRTDVAKLRTDIKWLTSHLGKQQSD